jgi:hypothetical protein
VTVRPVFPTLPLHAVSRECVWSFPCGIFLSFCSIFFYYFTSVSGFLFVFCVISSSTCFSSLWKCYASPQHKVSFPFHDSLVTNQTSTERSFVSNVMNVGILQVAVLQCKVLPVVTFFYEISVSTLHFKCLIGDSLIVRTNINLQGVSLARVLLLLFVYLNLE